jgi:HlyD family secretion protein
MSVTATIETRTRTNVISAPIASVTTRVLKPKKDKDGKAGTDAKANSVSTDALAADPPATNGVKGDKKGDEKNKPVEVVFVVDGDHVKTAPVKIGIFDDDYYEITDGLKEGDEIVTGGFHAISHDLDDGKRIVKGPAVSAAEKSKS